MLLRRRASCRACGRVHGPPMARCSGKDERFQPMSSDDDMNLPWTF